MAIFQKISIYLMCLALGFSIGFIVHSKYVCEPGPHYHFNKVKTKGQAKSNFDFEVEKN